MAHGTGLYWERLYDADLQNEEYVTIFSRLRDYWYPDMSDCYEPTSQWLDEYEVSVIKWTTDRYGHKKVNLACEGYRTGSISKEMANTIYWNIKNRKISFETCRSYFKEIVGTGWELRI